MLWNFVIILKELKLINEISKVGIRNLMYRDEIEVMTSVWSIKNCILTIFLLVMCFVINIWLFVNFDRYPNDVR